MFPFLLRNHLYNMSTPTSEDNIVEITFLIYWCLDIEISFMKLIY